MRNIIQQKRESFRIDIRRLELDRIFQSRRKEMLQTNELSENASFDDSELNDYRVDILQSQPNSLTRFKNFIISLISVDQHQIIELMQRQQDGVSFMDFLLGKLNTHEMPVVIELFAYILNRLYQTNFIAEKLTHQLAQFASIMQVEEDSRTAAFIVSIMGDLVKQCDPNIIIESHIMTYCLRVIDMKLQNISIMFLETFSYLVMQMALSDYEPNSVRVDQMFPIILGLYHNLRHISVAFYLYIAIATFAQRSPGCLTQLFKSTYIDDLMESLHEEDNMLTIEMIKVFQCMIQLDLELGRQYLEDALFKSKMIGFACGLTNRYLKLQEESISLLSLMVQFNITLEHDQIFTVLQGFSSSENESCQVAYINFITNLVSSNRNIQMILDDARLGEIFRQALMRSVKQLALTQLLYLILYYHTEVCGRFMHNLNQVRIMDVLDEMALRTSDQVMHNQVDCVRQFLQLQQ